MHSPIPLDSLLAYTATATALVLAPGPAQALVLARSVEQGARAGIITAVGLDAATLVHSLAAALGLSAILAASAAAFTVVKLAGAAYLIWLGLRMLRAKSGSSPPRAPDESRATGGAAGGARGAAERRGRSLLLHGFVTGLLNPKVALFFLAFLPQFVHPERGHALAQFLVLGGILAALDLVWASVLATAAARARQRLVRAGRLAVWRERVTGGILLALGLELAFTRR